MTKKDPQPKEDIKRGAEDEQGSAGIDSRNNNYNDEKDGNIAETIKNANASGIGAMGRNDQQQTGYVSNHSADAGNE
jgi:hypothetical protein